MFQQKQKPTLRIETGALVLYHDAFLTETTIFKMLLVMFYWFLLKQNLSN